MSWLFSQALVAEYSEGISLDGAQSALWNGTPTQLPSWCNDRTMANCNLSQSGMTFKLLTEENGEDVLMSYLAAFPVRTSVALGKEQASKESDHPCGRTWQESSVKFDLNTSLWKTHQCLWEEDLPESSVTLMKWGRMTPDGVLWERTTLGLPTSEIESGLWESWRSPAANEPGITVDRLETANGEPVGSNCRHYDKETGRMAQIGLSQQVAAKERWPTPRVGGEEGLDTLIKRKGMTAAVKHNLTAAVEHAQWPTPRAQESKHGDPTDWEMQTEHEGTKHSLRVQVAKREQKWPTPSANKTTSSGELVNADGTPWDGHSKPHSAQTGKPVQTALMDKVIQQNWPTPRSRDWKDGDKVPPSRQKNPDSATLGQKVAIDEIEKARNGEYGKKIQAALNSDNWPTPSASEGSKIPSQANYGQIGLSNHPLIVGVPSRAALKKSRAGQKQDWHTPTSHMAKEGNYASESQRNSPTLTHEAAVEEGQPKQPMKLNPDWVEWLMGWPIGWTSMEGITELDWRDWSVDPADELQPRGTNSEGLIPTPSSSETGLRNKNYAQGGQSIGVAIRKLGVGEGSVPRVTAGTKHRVGRLKAIGNGQCPQAAALAWTILSKAE